MFEHKFKLRFHDVDQAGIMFFGNIFKFSHDAYEEMIKGFNLSRDFFNDVEVIIPIIHSEADFKKPMKFGEEISIQVSVSKLLTSSFELTFNFMGAENDFRASVKTVHVLVDKNLMRKNTIPCEMRERLQTHKF